ncbi:MAG: succinylglutamate desuccinylase/aspartoacylase family protein, partial [Advenella sp.]
CDADVVLDLHCDNRAVMHVYSLPQVWDRCEPLARYLQSECQLLAEDSLSCSFDEMVSTPWLKLQSVYPEANIPLACFAATVELRGDRDLTHEYAEHDALALIQYLNQQNYIQLPVAQVAPMPPLRCEPHPLGGLAYVVTPCAGIVVYHVAAGQWVQRNQLLAEIVDPVALTVTPVNAPVGGFIFATAGVRLAQTETKLLSLSSPDDIGSVGLSP